MQECFFTSKPQTTEVQDLYFHSIVLMGIKLITGNIFLVAPSHKFFNRLLYQIYKTLLRSKFQIMFWSIIVLSVSGKVNGLLRLYHSFCLVSLISYCKSYHFQLLFFSIVYGQWVLYGIISNKSNITNQFFDFWKIFIRTLTRIVTFILYTFNVFQIKVIVLQMGGYALFVTILFI